MSKHGKSPYNYSGAPMIIALVLTAIALATLVAFAKWRLALFILVVVAAFQDPIRKLTPGTPGWMTLLSVPIFLAAVVSARLTMPHWWSQFLLAYPKIASRMFLMFLLTLPAAVISMTYGPGSWQYTLLGAFSYSLIFIAVIAGFHLGRDLKNVRRLLVVYALVHSVVLSGGVLQYLNIYPGWLALGDEALGHEWVRWVPGYMIRLISGFYRSADVMGWHAAAVCMIGMILAFSETGKNRWFWILISAWSVLALFLCGRRKMVYMIPVFLMVLTWIYFYVGRAARVLPILGFLIIPAVSVYLVNDFLGEDSSQIHYYTTANEGDGAFDRFQEHGFESLLETYEQAGFFGNGLGFATPGAHNIAAPRPRTWQESGTSRVLVELGVPGFLGFIAVLLAIVSALWRVTRAHLRARTPVGVFAAGLMAFFVANMGSLTVSGQILADSFIVIFLGTLVGVVLGFARKPFLPPEVVAHASRNA